MSKVKKRIQKRVQELKELKSNKQVIVDEIRVKRGKKEAELEVMRDEMNRAIFENTPEHEELQQLENVLKWYQLYEDNGDDKKDNEDDEEKEDEEDESETGDDESENDSDE